MATTLDPKSQDEPQVVLEVCRELNIDPVAQYAATWKKLPPLPRPEPAPFDRKECLARLKKVRASHHAQPDWSRCGLSVAMSAEEAAFWLQAMTNICWGMKAAELIHKLETAKPLKQLTPLAAGKLLRDNSRFMSEAVMLPLSKLLALEELVEVMLDETVINTGPKRQLFYLNQQVLDGFRNFVVPYLTEDDAEAIRQRVEGDISPDNWPQAITTRPDVAYHLAAFVGHPRLVDVVEAMDESLYDHPRGLDYFHQPQLIVMRLPSAELVKFHMQRLRLWFHTEYHVADWLATTELAGLDYLAEMLCETPEKTAAAILVDTFASSVNAPEAAEPMLHLMLNSKAPAVASGWLNRFVGSAIAGVIPVAAEGRGKISDAAVEYLNEQKRLGRAEVIEQQLEGQAANVVERIRRLVLDRGEIVYERHDASTLPAELAAAFNDRPPAKNRAKLPDWLVVAALPPILVQGRRLGDEHVELVIKTIRASKLDDPHPILRQLRNLAQPESLDAFAWRLFERWQESGSEPKEKWCLGAIGFLGGDDSVLKLTPLLRVWPGESQHVRAVYGLECLRAVGSDTALMQLNSIALKLKFKGLKEKARLFMNEIAKEQGLSPAELADRIVPDCGLDERGRREFDFGPRKFTFAFGPGLKPMVKDESGKVRADLPKPGVKDDAEKAGAAVAQWKLMKKQLRETIKTQVPRLEQAMVVGRRWKPADFERLIVKHPLMTHLARTLLWGGYDAGGKLVGTFRLTEEQDYADREDDATSIDSYAKVGVVHAADLSDEDKSAWGEVFGDYELIPPFEQITRRVYKLEPGEENEKEITRFNHVMLEPRTMVGILERLDWIRGLPQDAGIFHEHVKPFHHADITAVLHYEDGIPIGYMEGWDNQRLRGCYFVPGIAHPHGLWHGSKNKLPLGKVDLVVVSEVLRDLHVLASKAVE